MLRLAINCCAAILLAALTLSSAADLRADPSDAKLNGLPDLLAQFDMGEEFFSQFNDGELLQDAEVELIAPLLYRLGQVPRADRERWSALGEETTARIDEI